MTGRSLNILYLHHYANFGGASKSLLELIHAFPVGTVTARVVAPRGRVTGLFHEHNLEVLTARRMALFDNTRYSYYRGLRWLILLREVAALPWTWLALRRARATWRALDLIHVNEITLLPAAWLAHRLFEAPIVVHVRAVQTSRRTLRTRAVEALLRRIAKRLIAIDMTVRESLSKDLNVDIVHNSLVVPTAPSFATRKDRAFAVAMVGTLQKAKGCIEFVEAAALCRARGLDVRFLLVGESGRAAGGLLQQLLRFAGISQEIEPLLRARIAEQRLDGVVELQGFRKDIEAVYRSIDAVCFPSYYDAPGRPIFEAAMFGVPSIAAISSPSADTFVPGRTGIQIPAGDPRAIADAVETLYRDPRLTRALGEGARELAVQNCEPAANALRVLQIYREMLEPVRS